MLNDSQIAWVRKTLKRRGYITRNECLSKYISRLSSIIYRLREEGMMIVGQTVEYTNKKGFLCSDHRYTLMK